MEDVIQCPNCTSSDKWIIGADGVRCSHCNHWLTYEYDVYQILDKRLTQQAERLKMSQAGRLKMSKVEIAIEEVRVLQDRLQEINSLPFKDIVWTLRGKPYPINTKTIKDWDFTGLSNNDFITSGSYKEG